jgi:hypothetical protein
MTFDFVVLAAGASSRIPFDAPANPPASSRGSDQFYNQPIVNQPIVVTLMRLSRLPRPERHGRLHLIERFTRVGEPRA